MAAWQGLQDLMVCREVGVRQLYVLLGGVDGAPISLAAFKDGLPALLGQRPSSPEVANAYARLATSRAGISYDAMRRHLRTPKHGASSSVPRGARPSLRDPSQKVQKHGEVAMHAHPLSVSIVQSLSGVEEDAGKMVQAALVLNNTRIQTILRSWFPDGRGALSLDDFKNIMHSLGLNISDVVASSYFAATLKGGEDTISVIPPQPLR